MIETVRHNGVIQAIIITAGGKETGTLFITPSDFSQQLAILKHPKGKIIEAHYHPMHQRNILTMSEALILIKGRLRVSFYDSTGLFLRSREVAGGDAVLIVDCVHGFEVLEDVEMYEVKQGPHLEPDKFAVKTRMR